jgi:hypothetical protein
MKLPFGPQNRLLKSAVIAELAGFGALLVFALSDEPMDLSHRLFGTPSQPFIWQNGALEGLGICLVLAVVLVVQRNYMKRIKLLEGLLPICAFCKKIRTEDKWVTIEDYISDHSDASFSHGFCPSCGKENYSEYLKDAK